MTNRTNPLFFAVALAGFTMAFTGCGKDHAAGDEHGDHEGRVDGSALAAILWWVNSAFRRKARCEKIAERTSMEEWPSGLRRRS